MIQHWEDRKAIKGGGKQEANGQKEGEERSRGIQGAGTRMGRAMRDLKWSQGPVVLALLHKSIPVPPWQQLSESPLDYEGWELQPSRGRNDGERVYEVHSPAWHGMPEEACVSWCARECTPLGCDS